MFSFMFIGEVNNEDKYSSNASNGHETDCYSNTYSNMFMLKEDKDIPVLWKNKLRNKMFF